MIPGEYLLAGEPIELNSGRAAHTITVANTGDRPIQVGSHFHFFEANRYLSFDRAAAYGCRLDIPAGASVRFEPGEKRTVTVIPYAGTRHVWGFNGLVAGALDGPGAPEAARQRAREAGFAAPAEQGDDTR